MAQRHPKPMLDSESDVRELSDEEWRWAVRDEDFGGIAGSLVFLTRRAEILRAADIAGIPRTAFLHLFPSKPGFEDRVADAFGAVMKTAKHAAE